MSGEYSQGKGRYRLRLPMFMTAKKGQRVAVKLGGRVVLSRVVATARGRLKP